MEDTQTCWSQTCLRSSSRMCEVPKSSVLRGFWAWARVCRKEGRGRHSRGQDGRELASITRRCSWTPQSGFRQGLGSRWTYFCPLLPPFWGLGPPQWGHHKPEMGGENKSHSSQSMCGTKFHSLQWPRRPLYLSHFISYHSPLPHPAPATY